MAFMKLADTSKRRTRVLINGDTGSGKTHSLLSFPAPRIIMSLPGEEGYATLPEDDPDTTVFVWGQGAKVGESSLNVINEVEREMVKALATPGLQTLCLDGLHKFAAYVMDAMSNGAFFEGLKVKTESKSDTDVLDPRVWGQSDRWMTSFLNIARQASVPYMVATAWDADKQERKTRQGEKWTDVPTRKLPALYGSMARTVMGEFAVTVHASKGRLEEGSTEKVFRWQTQPDGMVMGAGIKAPPEIVSKIPKYVRAHWPTLEAYLRVVPTAS